MKLTQKLRRLFTTLANSKRFRLAVGSGLLVLLVGGGGYVVVAKMADDATMHDMHVIERALEDYLNSNPSRPDNLGQINPQLKGSLSDYAYTKAAEAHDGDIEVCATFRLPGRPLDQTRRVPNNLYASSDEEGAEKYAFHRAGRQCYVFGIHKQQIGVTQVLTYDESAPLPTEELDFAALTKRVEELSREHITLLGLSADTIYVSKSCRPQAGPRGQQVYDCIIAVQAGGPAQDFGSARIHLLDLKDRLQAQGFDKPWLSEYQTRAPYSDESSETHYAADLVAVGNEGLELRVGYTGYYGFNYSLKQLYLPDVAVMPAGFEKR